jgi:hypothetical protein
MARQVQIWVENEVITLDARGVWRSNGEPITHARTLEFFDRILAPSGEGWALTYGNETKPVTVEGTPFFADAFRDERNTFELRVRGRGWVRASRDSARYSEVDGDPRVTLDCDLGGRVRLLQQAHADFLLNHSFS